MRVEVYRMGLGWFDHTEPSRTTSSQVDQGVYGTYTLVLGGSTAANLLQPSQTTSVKMYIQVIWISLGWFGYTEPFRTTSPLYSLVELWFEGNQYSVPIHLFRVDQQQRGLSHAFEVVGLYRTFSNRISTVGTRGAG